MSVQGVGLAPKAVAREPSMSTGVRTASLKDFVISFLPFNWVDASLPDSDYRRICRSVSRPRHVELEPHVEISVALFAFLDEPAHGLERPDWLDEPLLAARRVCRHAG